MVKNSLTFLLSMESKTLTVNLVCFDDRYVSWNIASWNTEPLHKKSDNSCGIRYPKLVRWKGHMEKY